MKSKNPENANSPTPNEILLKRISFLKNLKQEETKLFQEIIDATNQGNLAITKAIDESIHSKIQSPIFAKRKINENNSFFFQKDFAELQKFESHLKNFLKPGSTTPIDARKLYEELESLQKTFRENSGNQIFKLTDEQASAIEGILTSNFHLVTGGPGTGKTSVISFLLKVMEKMEILPNPKDIVLVAPTGRAAQRLTESIQRNLSQMEPENLIYNSFKGQTLHSLLKLNPRTGIPKFGTERYLTQKLFILDEISMVDLKMMNLFLDAMKEGNQIILLGDPHQLPSVEKGNVISDLTNVLEGKSNFLSKLTISKRFDDSSSLSKISKQIQISFNTDLSPHTITAIPMDSLEIGAFKPKDKNIYWLDGLKPKDRQIQRNEMIDFLWKDVFWPEVLQIHNWKVTKDSFSNPETIERFASQIGRNRCLTIFRNNYFGLESIQSQLISLAEKKIARMQLDKKSKPIHSKHLNQNFYFEGMPLLIEVNDPSRKLFNGDIGLVIEIEGELRGVFLIENNLRSFALDTLPNHSPAFFLTVHKSQGSEYERVFLYLPPTDETLNEVSDPNGILNRQILYTAITRAKNEVVLIGDPSTWEKGLENYTKRVSGFQLVL